MQYMCVAQDLPKMKAYIYIYGNEQHFLNISTYEESAVTHPFQTQYQVPL